MADTEEISIALSEEDKTYIGLEKKPDGDNAIMR